MAIPLSRQHEHDIWYQSSSDPRDLSERVVDTDSDHQRTIIITVNDTRYPITEDILHKVFDPYGKIEMIHILPEAVHFKALLRFQYHSSVKSAKAGLHGRNIYDGCCRLDLQFLATTFWDCELSKENTIGSVYGDIYELMKEMSSTIDNLISQLESYKNSAAEKEIKNVEPQVFDQLPVKQFMELSAEKVDSNKSESTLMKENHVDEVDGEKLVHLMFNEIPMLDDSESKNAKDMKQYMSFLFDHSALVHPKVLETSYWNYGDEDSEKQMHFSGIMNPQSIITVQNAAHGLPVFKNSPSLVSKTTGTFYSDFISETNPIRILFDPGGYVVSTSTISIPLSFGRVMVGVSNLYSNSFGELMVSWMHMNNFLKFDESSSRIDAERENSHCCTSFDIKCLMVQCHWGEYNIVKLSLLLDPDGFEIECWHDELGKSEISNSMFSELRTLLQNMCSFEDLRERMRLYLWLDFHAYNKQVEGLYRPSYYDKLGNVILKRFLLLAVILERECHTSLPVKYNNLLANLVFNGNKVDYQQNPLIEYDFKVPDLSEDLCDGVQLCRTIGLLKRDPSILMKVVIPSDTLKKSLVNCGITLQDLRQASLPLLDEDETEIIGKDVVKGDKELTLFFIFHLHLPLLIHKKLLSDEISNVQVVMVEYSSAQMPLDMLLKWVQAVCETYEFKVGSFFSLLEGIAMCYLLDYYFRKEHDCSCLFKDHPDGTNREVYIMSVVEYTVAVHNFIPSQKLTSFLGNFLEVLQVSAIIEDKHGARNGQSDFGPSYKENLPNEQEFTVKRLSMEEVGWCMGSIGKLLVYEYGCLVDVFHYHRESSLLTYRLQRVFFGKLDPRGRGLVDPGGNVMTSFDNSYLETKEIWKRCGWDEEVHTICREKRILALAFY